jgi:hypothetical protein
VGNQNRKYEKEHNGTCKPKEQPSHVTGRQPHSHSTS